MGSDRCPSCAAAVRKDADWCTLCYADLRPAPAPVQRAPYPRSSTPPVAAQIADPLHAPYEHVLAAVYGGATDGMAVGEVPQPAPVTDVQPTAATGAWPCLQCGDFNGIEQLSCGSCGAVFGASLRSADPIRDRKKLMTYAVAGVIAFLALVAAITFATTKSPPPDTTPRGTDSTAPAVPGASSADNGGQGVVVDDPNAPVAQ